MIRPFEGLPLQMAHLIDHLWQSALFVALVWALTGMLRGHSAALRLRLWQVAAVKFLVPFAVFYAFGGWLGFPVRHSAIAPPAVVVQAVDVIMPAFGPAQTFRPSGLVLGAGLLLALLLTAASVWLVAREWRKSRVRRIEEAALIEADWTSAPAPPGFFKTVILAGSVLMLVAAPVIGGAIRDRQWRQRSLAVDTERLRHAEISLAETPWRFGDRTEIVASADHVLIRKINLQDLVALVYAIGEFEVFGGALPWLESPHYDLRVAGRLHDPKAFDPYALREPVTNYLSQEFGVAIRVNGACQEPCLNQESFTVERLPWKILNPVAGK